MLHSEVTIGTVISLLPEKNKYMLSITNNSFYSNVKLVI